MTEPEASADATHSNSGDQNLMFSGMSFYVSHTVPSRDHFCKMITANGGIVCQVDSKAEVVIVDHLRQATYQTAVYGYKFLEDCSKNKRLEDIEKYLVNGKAKRATKTERVTAKAETAPKRFPKTGRVPFTDEDDQILLNWISGENIPRAGNKIYQGLEERFPHHTYQSWRSRWVDQLSKNMPDGPKPSRIINFDDYEPRSVGAHEEEEEDGEGGEKEGGENEGGEKEGGEKEGGEKERGEKEGGAKEGAEKEGAVAFTRTDDKILMQWKDKIIHAANEKTVYKKIHEQFPHHSAIEWRNRFTNTLLPRLNKIAVDEAPVAEGEAEDTSPRPSEVLPEVQSDSHVPEVVGQQQQQQQPADEPPPPPATRSRSRRTSDQGVDYSRMGQVLSTRNPAKKTRHSLPVGTKLGHQLPAGHVADPSRSPSSEEEDDKPHTPTNHDTHLFKPPRSPKGHIRKDLPLSSPRVKTDSELSPAVRVQQWRADVSRHTTAETSGNAEEDELLKQEIGGTSPPLPSNAEFQPRSPSPTLGKAAQVKRKRDSEPVTPKPSSTHKRVRTIEQTRQESSSTPAPQAAPSNSQFPSTPPLKSSGVRRRSPTFSDLDSLKPVPPTSSRVTSAVKMKESYQGMSTQAIYDSIPDGAEDLFNEDIPGLGDSNKMDENEDDFRPSKSKDDDIFLSRNGDKGTLSFESAPYDVMEGIEKGGRGEEDEEDLDEEAAKQQEEEIAKYLSVKATEYGVSEKDVIEAIERTSGEKNLVDVVLSAISKGEGLPRNVSGIWLPEEDQVLLNNNGRLIMFLEKKHGDRVLERMEWLEKWQEA